MDPKAAVFVPVPERVKMVIRRVLYYQSPKFDLTALVSKPAPAGTVLYRGQCAESTKNIPRIGNNPLEISLDYGKPISTSLVITPKIKKFACKPKGRMFEIHVDEGVPIAELSESIKGYTFTPETFQFLKAELPDGSSYKALPLNRMLGIFFSILKSEREVLLDPTKGRFLKPSGEDEDWSSPEVDEKYVTRFALKAGGRRRTLRSRRKKRTYRRRV